jgi:hypothetical protein
MMKEEGRMKKSDFNNDIWQLDQFCILHSSFCLSPPGFPNRKSQI